MTYEQKPNSGAIFKNDRKEKETHPDYRGTINVEGKDFEISLWTKEGKNGKFFSASIKEPYKKNESVTPASFDKDPKDDLPF